MRVFQTYNTRKLPTIKAAPNDRPKKPRFVRPRNAKKSSLFYIEKIEKKIFSCLDFLISAYSYGKKLQILSL